MSMEPDNKDIEFDGGILFSTKTADYIHERLQRYPQGQLFELYLRPNSSSSFRYFAHIAGSALYSTALHHWRKLFRGFTRGEPLKNNGTNPLTILKHHGKTIIWRLPNHPFQQQDIQQLLQYTESLKPVADFYQNRTQQLLEDLNEIRSVEDWQMLSQQRIQLIKETIMRIVNQAKSSLFTGSGYYAVPDITIFLSGSCRRGLGMISDIDFIPVFSQVQHPILCELIERIASGLCICGIKSDNVAAGTSYHRFLGLSLPHWRAELAASRSKMRLASALNSLVIPPAVDNPGLTKTFVDSLSSNRSWIPGKYKWHRRWNGWWTELETKLQQIPSTLLSSNPPLQVHLQLRRLAILREMYSLAPAVLPLKETESIEFNLLRSYLAWLRDILHFCIQSPPVRSDSKESPDSTYLQQAAMKMGMKTQTDLEHSWVQWITKIDELSELFFKSFGWLRWGKKLRHFLGKCWMDKVARHTGSKPLVYIKPLDMKSFRRLSVM